MHLFFGEAEPFHNFPMRVTDDAPEPGVDFFGCNSTVEDHNVIEMGHSREGGEAEAKITSGQCWFSLLGTLFSILSRFTCLLLLRQRILSHKTGPK